MTEGVLVPNVAMPCPDRFLDPDEKPIWWDRPDPVRFASRHLIPRIVFFTFFIGFSVFWMYGASKSGGLFWMFGLIFFGAGLWGASEPLRLYRTAASVRYLLTDRRAVVATGYSQKSFAIRNIRAIEVRGEAGRLGDVLFFDVEVENSEGPNTTTRDGFIGITDAEAVAREIRRLQAAST